MKKSKTNITELHSAPGASVNLGDSRKKSPRIDDHQGKLSLTQKQNTVYLFLIEHNDNIGYPPTIREIANHFKISAKAAHDHLKAIAKKGYLRLSPGSARGIEILSKNSINGSSTGISSEDSFNETMITIPLLGTIAAGKPILAEENVDTHITLPSSMLPKTGEMFSLKIKGDSMEKAGILDGDIAVLKKVNDVHMEVKNGDIVAALIDGEATLKTYFKKNSIVELRPENDSYAPIILHETNNVSIIAKLAGVYRQYRT